ncbi:uncharacterized protein LOC111913805 [Lactuca sativa]|uniref:uncharacterized protein LOC111913805 n=1 Tax=Lactuca sativa TaxID=4236 RepID=UPI000CD818A7|nr:uncharacterized protein LOC111913805 [Lactuca sativa]XP_023765285.1 uncharacterized protein LOC111913805 [Lactuca sativa]XP_023765286.1 uncharacterized protein LOC111913805 [Lactuca sativa]XP_023765287.1 uncharacterized protein LOC111913805 [Lactuca sativa]XP_023765288.1 uncharacterized protein LOC111913805 [Lactuca sativa]
MMIKYLFKYISKRADRFRYPIQKAEAPDESYAETSTVGCTTSENEEIQPINEVENFLDGRYIFPHEAAWRILNFHIHHRHPPIQTLSVHEENMQQVIFKGDSTIPEVLSNPVSSTTTLLRWFHSNMKDLKGRDLTYLEYPKSYKWESSSKSWSRRVDKSLKMVGRLVFVHPSSGELFYLWMLLCHQKGCTSFEDLRTVSGTVYRTFRGACNVLGLIGDDIEWLTAFTEASVWVNSLQLRSFFCHLLLFCEVSNPGLLWETACEKMKDDYIHTLKRKMPDKDVAATNDIIQQQLLHDLEHTLRSSVPSKAMTDFDLPMPLGDIVAIFQNRMLLEEMSYDKESLRKQHAEPLRQLNNDQMLVYKLLYP